VYGIARRDPRPAPIRAHKAGQTVARPVLLIWALERLIDAALVDHSRTADLEKLCHVARNDGQVVASAGSRYTYSANPTYAQAIETEPTVFL